MHYGEVVYRSGGAMSLGSERISAGLSGTPLTISRENLNGAGFHRVLTNSEAVSVQVLADAVWSHGIGRPNCRPMPDATASFSMNRNGEIRTYSTSYGCLNTDANALQNQMLCLGRPEGCEAQIR